jgi:NADPH:quinone reductase-like Zn-dependent oxidoreductase
LSFFYFGNLKKHDISNLFPYFAPKFKMKAIYLNKYGNSATAFETKETEIPQAGKGELIVKVHSFGLNFADVVARRGLYPDAPKNPAVLGYDVAGTIYAIGAGVEGYRIGQRVTALTRFGGYAEYAKTMQEGVSAIPDSMDFATATALATQACTAYFCAYESVKLHEGDKVLIHAAAGGVGSLLVQMAKHEKCVVYGTASGKKMDYLKSIGVDFPIDYTQNDFSQIIKDAGHRIDVAFDSVGGSTFKKSMKILNAGGRMVTYGAAEQINGNNTNKLKALKTVFSFGIFSPLQMLMMSRAVIGVNMLKIADNRRHVFKHCLDNVVQMAQKGIIKPRIDKVFKANDIVQAHDYLESRQSMGKVVVEW